MRKTTVFIEVEQAVLLKRASNKSGRSQAELIREGVDLILAQGPVERPRLNLMLRSGDPTWAERTDEILAAGFGEDG